MHLTCCLSLREKRGCRMGEKKEETKWHQSFDWKLCHSGQEQLLRSWTVPLSVDQLNNSQSFFLPFSVIHITPTITALRSCIFCLCKPRRQCVYWPFCCFWNVSQKIVLSKISSFFSVLETKMAENILDFKKFILYFITSCISCQRRPGGEGKWNNINESI